MYDAGFIHLNAIDMVFTDPAIHLHYDPTRLRKTRGHCGCSYGLRSKGRFVPYPHHAESPEQSPRVTPSGM